MPMPWGTGRPFVLQTNRVPYSVLIARLVLGCIMPEIDCFGYLWAAFQTSTGAVAMLVDTDLGAAIYAGHQISA